MKKFLIILLSAIMFSVYCLATEIKDAENILVMELKDGKVFIEMYPDSAPNHVTRIKELVRKGFYDGLKFHRVIKGFVAQTGDPKGTGTGGSGKKIKAEFNKRHHARGTVSMARGPDKDSADSQFFICYKDYSYLDGQYTIWGKVVKGMEYVDNIKKSEDNSGSVKDPDVIISMKVLADIKK